MEIRISTGDELNLLLDALAREIVDANIYHRLFCDLLDAIPEYEREFQQSQTFWHIILNALMDSRMANLCKVYDQESKSLNLVNLLHTIKANLPFFTPDQFRKRMAGNAFLDSLASYDRIPKIEDVESDIESVTCQDPVVKKLIIWRNNIVAHRGAKVSLGKDQILVDNSLSQEEVEQLLDHSLKVFNKYSGLYRASSHSRQIIGHDDYKDVFKFIRLGLKKWDDDLAEERRKMKAGKA
jgi:hypothetical protein